MQVKHIGRRIDLRERVPDIADAQGQYDPSLVQNQTMKTRHRDRPDGAQGLRQNAVAKLGRAAGMMFQRQVMQLLRMCRIVTPCLPGREKILSSSEGGIQDNAALLLAPHGMQLSQSQQRMLRQRKRRTGRIFGGGNGIVNQGSPDMFECGSIPDCIQVCGREERSATC